MFVGPAMNTLDQRKGAVVLASLERSGKHREVN